MGNKFTIITSFNDNPTYKPFVSPMVRMWNKFGYDVKIAYIMDNGDPNHGIEEIEDKAEIIPFKRMDGIESGIQAKVSRMWLASKQKDFSIADVDLFVLNINHIEANWFSKYNGDNILAIGGDHYAFKGSDKGKWPMHNTSGSGELLSRMINPKDLDYEEWILSNKNTEPVFDNMEDTGNEFRKFSDESLLRRLILTSAEKEKLLHINRLKGFSIPKSQSAWYLEDYKRIDRTWAWTFNREKLYAGHYIDCVPGRPFNEKDLIIKEIFKYIGI